MEFMPIIDDCSGKGLAIVIPHDPFARILKQKFQPFKNPYMFAYALSFSVMLHFAHGNPSRERIELIFDNNVIKPKQAEEAYKEIFRVYPPDVTALLGRSEPRFEDDKKFNALQASDLLAYCVRARYESGAKYEQVKRSPVYEVLAGGPAKLYEPGMYAIGNHTVLVEIGDAQMEDFKRRANQKRGS